MDSFARQRRPPLLACCGMLGMLLTGCGENLSRYPVTGKVTYLGKEVEMGSIMFEPEESVGKLAPTCYAAIENGAYKTLAAESPTKGAYKVHVMVMDKEKARPASDSAKSSQPIVLRPAQRSEYVVSVEIPPPGGKLDIDVPAEEKRSTGRPGAER